MTSLMEFLAQYLHAGWIDLAFSVVAILLSFVTYLFGERVRSSRDKLRAVAAEEFRTGKEDLAHEYGEVLREKFTQYLEMQQADGSIPPLLVTDYKSVEAVRLEARELVGELRARLTQIEERFPNQTTLEKIASVNEAIIGTQLEHLTDAIKRLEDKQLTKWDVATIVLQVIAALGALVGLSLAILNYFKP